jgi:hypothetical protein
LLYHRPRVNTTNATLLRNAGCGGRLMSGESGCRYGRAEESAEIGDKESLNR